MVKHSQSSQNSKFAMSVQYFKEVRDEVSNKLISTLWALKFSRKWYYHYWWVWTSILKVLKVTSLQYLYNISKKESKVCSSFFALRQIQSFHKLALSFLMEITRRVRSSQNRISLIFFECLKKKVSQLPFYSTDAKHSDILRGASHVFCYLLSLFLIHNSTIPLWRSFWLFYFNETSCLSKYIQVPLIWFYFLWNEW